MRVHTVLSSNSELDCIMHLVVEVVVEMRKKKKLAPIGSTAVGLAADKPVQIDPFDIVPWQTAAIRPKTPVMVGFSNLNFLSLPLSFSCAPAGSRIMTSTWPRL
ncbi:hypothetical protein TWF173_005102 [Orbilia oligospora]|uniref:Uncharacterized protein n=1 Tax=Orbilia oligospora TaxID=2813651 RepID=A0A7C8VFH1_ORBOL|nr:hypothetical protein TWF970_005942 [Orbilia oligospora]KAF3313997.1 hypothetical protein TWF173_005102 [Orbilia oligospora]